MPELVVKPLYYVCLLKKFNNYFNRIIKGYAALSDYEDAAEAYYYYADASDNPIAVNFDFADNVSTELVMNDCPFEPDYLLLLTPDENGDLQIVSRWFVMETVFTRKGQYKHTLRRDTIYDHLENLLDSPVFVQKAMLPDSDPMILNSEGMSFNEIKTDEALLKDKTNSAWIVGYIAKNAAPSDVTIQTVDEDFDPVQLSTLASDLGITEAALAALLNLDGTHTNAAKITTKIDIRYGDQRITESIPFISLVRNDLYYTGGFSADNKQSNLALSWSKPLWKDSMITGADTFNSSLFAYIANHQSDFLSAMPSITSRTYLNEESLEILRSYVGKVFLYNGLYYTFSIDTGESAADEVIGPSVYTTWPVIQTAVNACGNALGNIQADGEVSIRTTSTTVYLMMNYASAESGVIPGVTTKISSSRKALQGQSFDMFAIPYGEVSFNSDIGVRKSVGELGKFVAAEIARELDSACYDIQLLPYCPFASKFSNVYRRIDLTALTEGEDFDYIKQTTSVASGATGLVTGSGTIPFGTSWTFEAAVPVADAQITSITFELVIGYGAEVSSYTTSHAAFGPGSTLTVNATLTSIPTNAPRGIIKYTYNGTQYVSFIYWCRNNTFSNIISKSLSLKDDMKIEVECNKYRLVSPNYQGSFDFSVARNGGAVDYFTAECTYKPYTPYIKVSPAFSWMYGANYGDNRGLICGGDYSLPRLTDAWESFELNNKNYQNIFNREIQNLDFRQSLEMRQSLITGALGVGTAGIVGAAAGAKIGMSAGPYGALAGGIAGSAIGAGGSAAGMALDVGFMAARQREEKQLSIDKFNYQLGNVKALPYTLTKIGAFDINSKIWPFLEYYTCTPEEKEALRNKIVYESMTVMRIGTLREFLNPSERHYFKGELIRNEKIAEDNHIFEAIYSELMKGVYI